MSTMAMPDRASDSALRLEPLLHPAEFSRMLLALSATTVTLGAYVAFLLAVGGPVPLAIITGGILLVLGSVWLVLQLFRARLLGQSVRVSAESLPEIQSLIDDVRARLDYHRPVDVHVIQKATPSLSLTSYFGTKVIVLEGSLIGDLIGSEDRAQLTFLLARSFGALKARHERFSSVVIVLDGLRLLPFVAQFLLPYFRATTYSGDQIGLACCGSADVALTATERLLVGREVEPTLRVSGVVAQAEFVRRRWLPRLIQFLSMPEPHLTNRYLNLLLFCARHDPEASERLRASLDDTTRARLEALARRSAHGRPAVTRSRRSVLAAVAAGVTLALLGGATALALSLHDAVNESGSEFYDPAVLPPPPPVYGSDPSGQSTEPASSGGEALLSHIPAAVRSSCTERDVVSPPASALASVKCEAGEVTVYYNSFASADDLEAELDATRAANPGATDGEDCEAGSYDGPWNIDGTVVGQLLCWQTEGASWIRWSHDELLIEAHMLALDDDSAALVAAWRDAGPQ